MPELPHAHHFECRLTWTGARFGATDDYGRYSREYTIELEGKPALTLSAAPAFKGDAALANPEDLLVAALSGCHCLSYLALCARAGVRVAAYEDHATGILRREGGVMRFTEVRLRTCVTVARAEQVARALELHARAHEECFIASSVNFPVLNEPRVTSESFEGSSSDAQCGNPRVAPR
jgi:organic hydroperoxide reductase OsmC/OhrA